MSVHATSGPNTYPDPRGRRLESWKEIAAYLGRDVTTVRRWERRERLPVYRIHHSKLGSVYAYTMELDAWRDSRAPAAATDVADVPPVLEIAWRGVWARRWLVVCGVAMLALLVVAYFTTRSRLRAATGWKIKSLAVLPLKNLSGDPTQEYLADGMTEALISRLSSIHDLHVISRTSAMQFKNTPLSVPEIAKTLHVEAIVEGSVIRDASRIRVHAQLIRAATDEHFWSEAYDRELRDVLALESEVAQSIAKKVEVTVTGEEQTRLTAARSVSPEVYEDYLQGRFALANKCNSKAGIEESIGLFEEAIARDPTFAPAYVGLANAHADLSTVFIGAPPAMERPKVESAARKALELDPELAEAHALLAAMQQEHWQWAEAEAEYKRAVELDWSDAAAYNGLARWLISHGRTEEALSWVRRGRGLDPFAVSGTDVAWVLFLARRYDEAMHELRSVLALQPNDAMTLWFSGFVLIANNQPQESIPVLEKALSVSNHSPGVIGVLVRAYAHTGRRTDALGLLAELKRRKEAGYVPAAAFVNAYLGLGENEEAFAWLEQAYKEQSNILQWLKVHPYFDPLRDDPRFKDLLRRVGLDQARWDLQRRARPYLGLESRAKEQSMSTLSRDARIAGLLYLTLLTAPLRLIYIPSKLFVPGNASATANNIAAHETLFRLGIVSDLFTATMAIFLTLALYRLFMGVDQGLARLVVILGALMVTPIYFLNTINDAAALLLARGADFLNVFDKPQCDALVMVFLRMHSQGILANEIFWGLWLFPFGLLVYKSRFLPRILGVWLMLNCFAYLATSLTGMLWPQYEQRISNWVFPVMLGEPAIILWLIIMGAKERQPLAIAA